MNFITFVLLYMSFSSNTNAIDVYSDNPDNGLILTEKEKVNVLIQYKSLHYTFNVYTAKNLFNWYNKLPISCESNNMSFTEYNLEHHILWNDPRPQPQNNKKNITQINMQLYYESQINKKIQDINQATNNANECGIINNIKQLYNAMNLELNKLAELDLSSLNEVILLEEISIEISKMCNENDILPFSLTHDFGKNFIKYSKFNFFQTNYTVTLAFYIPFYETVTLFNFYTKPFIQNNQTLILNTQEKYVISPGNRQQFFSDSSIEKNCFISNKMKFCQIPQFSNKCEQSIFQSNVTSKHCLTKLPNRNIITQIENDLYIILLLLTNKNTNNIQRKLRSRQIQNSFRTSFENNKFTRMSNNNNIF